MRNLVILFLLASTLGPQAFANQCSQLFFRDPFQKQSMTAAMASALKDSIRSLSQSTTGARIEKKWTLMTTKITSLIDGLSKELSISNILIAARDKVTAGFVNVTHTTYLDQFRLNLKDSGFEFGDNVNISDVTMKPRVRKYGTVDIRKPVSLDNVQFAEFTKDYSFFEFKFPDARFNGAVFKPRMLMADRHIAMLGTPEFIKNHDMIMKHTLALEANKSNLDSAQGMLKFLLIGHQQGATFGKVAVNLYERISYAVDFYDFAKNTKFQVQMTLDKSISLLVFELGKAIEAYRPEHSVIEIKIPVEYADVKLPTFDSRMVEVLAKIPGYESFLNFVSTVQTSHLKDEYMEGVGKNGHGHRGYLRAVNK